MLGFCQSELSGAGLPHSYPGGILRRGPSRVVEDHPDNMLCMIADHNIRDQDAVWLAHRIIAYLIMVAVDGHPTTTSLRLGFFRY